ncbi:MAG: HMA2 domain-containing protein [Syntrophobacteraceae bacterium]
MADHTEIVSSTPRRTRIRVSRKRRNPKEMARLARALEAFPEISGVETNLHTGSLIVHHKKEVLGDIQSTLEDMGVIVMAATGGETSAQSLMEAIADLDKRLGGKAKSFLDLKLLVPLGLGALAVVQLVRRGFQIEGAPWYILAYFAIESFTRLNRADEKEKCAPQEPV